MHIQVLKENLLKALTIASRYSAQKAQLPVLGHLLIEATKTGIYVSATDLDMGIRLRFAGKVIEPGEVVVPARILAEYIGVLPLGVIEVKSEKEEQIVVAAKQSRATFQILSRADFPDLPKVTDEDKLGEMATKDWLAIWQAVEYSISKDLARPVLTGILWELNRGKLVATDGYRLTIMENDKMQFGAQQEKIIVNGAFWGVIAKTLYELQITGGAIYLLRKEKQLMIEAPDITLVGRLIEGEYPNYQAILPQKGETAIVTEREALLSAVRGAMIFARDSAQIVKLKFTKAGLRVAAAAQIGGAEANILGDGEGPELATAFNGKFLQDFLGHSKAQRVRIELETPLKPGLFTEEDNQECRHVIMPIRLREEEGKEE